MSRPYRTNLTRRFVADREDEVHVGRIGSRELLPPLAAQAIYGVPRDGDELRGQRMHVALRKAPRAVCDEATLAKRIQQGLCHLTARRITGAQKQYVVSLFHDEPCVFPWWWPFESKCVCGVQW